MKFKMSPNSLFAILLRSPWWISVLVAAGLFLLGRLFIPAVYAVFLPLPFVVIGAITGWRQFQAPSKRRIAATLESAREMSWEAFSKAVADGYRRDGYVVTPLKDPAADFLVERASRTALVSCRRWKAARTGQEPLEALQAARLARDVHDGIYLTTGEVTAQALAYAARHQLRLAQGPALLTLLGTGAQRR